MNKCIYIIMIFVLSACNSKLALQSCNVDFETLEPSKMHNCSNGDVMMDVIKKNDSLKTITYIKGKNILYQDTIIYFNKYPFFVDVSFFKNINTNDLYIIYFNREKHTFGYVFMFTGSKFVCSTVLKYLNRSTIKIKYLIKDIEIRNFSDTLFNQLLNVSSFNYYNNAAYLKYSYNQKVLLYQFDEDNIGWKTSGMPDSTTTETYDIRVDLKKMPLLKIYGKKNF